MLLFRLVCVLFFVRIDSAMPVLFILITILSIICHEKVLFISKYQISQVSGLQNSHDRWFSNLC